MHLLRKGLSHMYRLNKGKQENIDLAIIVFHSKRFYISIINRSNIYSAVFHQTSSECQPFRRIVIAAYDENLQPPFRELYKKIIKKFHGIRLRNRLIVYVACQYYGLRLFIVDYIYNFIQYILLILHHRKSVDTLSYMKI